MATLTLIPAKGCSTRLPRKNILPLGGKPLLAWAAEAARRAGVCGRIIISTEDEAVAAVAREYGIDVPFLRPAELGCDPAGVVQVALHALQTLRTQGEEYKRMIILLPTSPFRTASDIAEAVALFDTKQAKFLLSVSAFDHTPFAAMKLEDGVVSPWFPEYFGRKSQEMPSAFRPNGAIHVLDVAAFEAAGSYFGQPLYAYEMPWPRSLDIDTVADLQMAEAVLAAGLVSWPV
ncbi:CMP-N-acetylneuraminic acid synthetase [Chitinivorax tropicus]|uniref:CMP-N-acetylneuraminic acid synthetase n=1 Tax=Chitinivorax tropicus TaxID=714531 RepID=A0A840MI53_9PROT|nr:acylneuraminate cytidylyltransferase family protein [Chitinivorax tropicus]MBB5016869.1 CMP-N-acetylneuraminic acid synthetase [Chitinivorax tropicus]